MKWLRYQHDGRTGFGTLTGDQIQPHTGDLFDNVSGPPQPGGTPLALADVTLLPPCEPRQVVALWNNFRALAEKNGWTPPAEPLYFLKSPASVTAYGQPVAVPASYDGRVSYEGELAIVIGRRAQRVAVADAAAHIAGYTCANDITAMELLQRDPGFTQWTRAKSFDGFCPLGPVIDTDFNPATATLRTLVAGRERQNYALADMFFSPAELVSRLSHDLTLLPGDVILCGTSLGVLPMKPGSTVEVTIDGIGTLSNVFG